MRYHRLWPNDILNYGKADNTSVDNRLIHHRDDDGTHVIEFQVCLSLQTYLNFLNTIRDTLLVVHKIWSEHRFCVLSFVPCCHNSRLHTDTDWSPNVVPKGILFEFISWAKLKMYQRLQKLYHKTIFLFILLNLPLSICGQSRKGWVKKCPLVR